MSVEVMVISYKQKKASVEVVENGKIKWMNVENQEKKREVEECEKKSTE